MSELTLYLPETLQHRLELLAKNEGVPLTSYILYILTKQASLSYTIEVNGPKAIDQQQENFAAYLQQLGKGSDEQIAKILAERDVVESEPDLHPETIAKLKLLIAEQQA